MSTASPSTARPSSSVFRCIRNSVCATTLLWLLFTVVPWSRVGQVVKPVFAFPFGLLENHATLYFVLWGFAFLLGNCLMFSSAGPRNHAEAVEAGVASTSMQDRSPEEIEQAAREGDRILAGMMLFTVAFIYLALGVIVGKEMGVF